MEMFPPQHQKDIRYKKTKRYISFYNKKEKKRTEQTKRLFL
jgi:hypothetical protein